MSVVVDVERVGIYRKLADKTAEIGVSARLLNDDPRRYGMLEGEDQMDLKKGCDGLRDEGYGDLFHSFSDYIMKTSRRGIPLKEALGSNFVTTRRSLMLIANMSVYKYPFVMRALRRKGVIFLCEAKSENEGPYEHLFEGHKFDQYMTLNDNGEPHDEYEPVSNAECTRAVLRTSLKSGDDEMNVLYTAVVDAQDKDGNFVEIKSSKFDINTWFKKRSLSHYLQSYLATVSYIIHGETDEDKVVKCVSKIPVNSIPNMGMFWKSSSCFEKLFKTFQEIQNRLTLDDTALIIRNDGRYLHYEEEDANRCHFVDPEFLNFFE